MLHHPTRYLVIYKDSAKARNRYFGPFASGTLAQDFCERLPEPIEGGGKTWKLFSPYTHDEVSIAGQAILNARENGDLQRSVTAIMADLDAQLTPT